MKGYHVNQFTDELARYPVPTEGGGNNGYIGYNVDNKNNDVTDVTDVTRGTVADVADVPADFEERAAILQFDEGLSRDEAEARAADELKLPTFLDRRKSAA